MTGLLDIAKLRVRFPSGFEALKGVSLSVMPGEIAGLVGESGSGKSMTALSILRLLPRDARAEGRIAFEGADILSLRPADLLRLRGREIAYIPQEPMSALNPTLRTGTQLAMPLMMVDGVAKPDALVRAAKVLAEMHVADPQRILDSYPFELSGGLRQRVLLANAFLRGPKLILADEPTTALDVTVQAEVLAILKRRAREKNTAVLFVTHNMGAAWMLCDSIHVMQEGVIVESGPARDVLRHPNNAYTRKLLDSLPERATPRHAIAGAR